MKQYDKETNLRWYRDILLWRNVEETLAALYVQQKVKGFLHLYSGQEAVAAGITYAIDPKKDRVITAYRCHVMAMAMGIDPKYVFAELMGRTTGCSKGLGGSMHLFSKEHNFYGGHGIVGGQIPLGAGLAFADKYFERDSVTVAMMGDGAVWQGIFHETLNLSAILNLPVIFVCENNGYAMGTSVERSTRQKDLYKLGLHYEMPCYVCGAMHPAEVAETMSKAVAEVRSGKGPCFVELRTYRFRGHSVSDPRLYRSKEEEERYKALCPSKQLLSLITKNSWATAEEIQKISDEIDAQISAAVEFADSSPYPDSEELYRYVYSEKNYPFLDKN